jgi:hypothetical protein
VPAGSKDIPLGTILALSTTKKADIDSFADYVEGGAPKAQP